MDKQVQEITTNVTETGKIELVSYEWTPDKVDFPRHADVLRDVAFDQARDLASALDKTLRKTIEQLCDETDSLTDDEEGRLSKAFYSMHKARRALHKTYEALWEWQYDLEDHKRAIERMEQLDKALKELDESDKTDNQ